MTDRTRCIVRPLPRRSPFRVGCRRLLHARVTVRSPASRTLSTSSAAWSTARTFPVPASQLFDGTASSGLRGIGALGRQSLTRLGVGLLMREQGPARGGHATPTCPAIIAMLSLASLADEAARTAAARLWPAARRRTRRQEPRRCRRRWGPQQGQGRGIPDAVSASPPRISQFRRRFPRLQTPPPNLVRQRAGMGLRAWSSRHRSTYGYGERAGNEGLSACHAFLPRHGLLFYRLDLYIKSGSAPEGLFSPCPARPPLKASSAVSRSTD
jgi:hypothetical protein